MYNVLFLSFFLKIMTWMVKHLPLHLGRDQNKRSYTIPFKETKTNWCNSGSKSISGVHRLKSAYNSTSYVTWQLTQL